MLLSTFLARCHIEAFSAAAGLKELNTRKERVVDDFLAPWLASKLKILQLFQAAKVMLSKLSRILKKCP